MPATEQSQQPSGSLRSVSVTALFQLPGKTSDKLSSGYHAKRRAKNEHFSKVVELQQNYVIFTLFNQQKRRRDFLPALKSKVSIPKILMKLMCYLICFVMGLLMVGCGGEDEPVTKDKPAPIVPVVNLIRSEPPKGSIISLSDDLGTPVEIQLFFDRLPSYVSAGGKWAQLQDDHAFWEVTTQQFLDALKPNPAVKGGADLSVAWVNPDGSDGEATLTFIVGFGGNPPELLFSSVSDGDADVDPQRLNAGGIRFDFDREVRGNVTIWTKGGKPLNWIANIDGVTVTLTAVAGGELQHGVVYVIHIEVISNIEEKTEGTITFRTKDE